MKKKRNKIAFSVAVILILIGFYNIETNAWFSRKRQTAHPVMIDQPQTVFIKAGHAENIMYLDISDIDVEEKIYDAQGKVTGSVTSKNFVFCIDGEDFSSYTLQFAHTNNIPFTYKIYHATEVDNEADATYVSSKENKNFYYAKGDELVLTLKNIAQNQTYNNNDNVQALAVPYYYQADDIQANNGQQMTSSHFTDYYILEVRWDSSLRNNKETDIVCITVNGKTAWTEVTTAEVTTQTE